MPYIVDSLKIRPVKVLHKYPWYGLQNAYTVKCLDTNKEELITIYGKERLYGTEKASIPQLIRALDLEIEWCKLRIEDLQKQKEDSIRRLTNE